MNTPGRGVTVGGIQAALPGEKEVTPRLTRTTPASTTCHRNCETMTRLETGIKIYHQQNTPVAHNACHTISARHALLFYQLCYDILWATVSRHGQHHMFGSYHKT
jgi:hypothetical protein